MEINPSFKIILEKYIGKRVTDQSTTHKNYVSTVKFMQILAISRIRSEIGDGPIWVSIGETTDVDGRCICNHIVSFLHEDNKLFKALGEELKNVISKLPIGKIFNDATYDDVPIMTIRS
ncbi:DUF659 domain-containing protein [Aphis craccivora]|uniref:DUF659 domain-containing protein n=1 Tax=Aphis craccivora TaxID=307492 RepID=A0A6G0Z903_APHCR|nr:DUF659 domain-containing protein [Aphis craccivora]